MNPFQRDGAAMISYTNTHDHLCAEWKEKNDVNCRLCSHSRF